MAIDTLVFQDAFTEDVTEPLDTHPPDTGTSWTVDEGGINAHSGDYCIGNSEGGYGRAHIDDAVNNNQSAEINLQNAEDYQGPIVRYTSAGGAGDNFDGYCALWRLGIIYSYKRVNGSPATWVLLGSESVTYNFDDNLKIVVNGTGIEIFENDVSRVGPDTDSDYASGSAAIRVRGDLRFGDNFEVYHEVGGVTHQLAGLIAGVSTLSGAMIATRGLVGQIAGISSLSGVMAVVRSLAGEVASASALLGNLTATLSLLGQVDGVSALTGILRKICSLAGQIAGQSSLSGAIILTKRLAGLVEALSGVSGGIDIQKALAGQIDAISTLTGTLTTVGEEIAEIIELTGLLIKTIGVAGSFTKTSIITGELVKEVEVIGQLRE